MKIAILGFGTVGSGVYDIISNNKSLNIEVSHVFSRLFGLPIVLNPIFFIPFVFGPVVLSTVAYLLTSAKLIPVATVVIPWVTPPVIGGVLATQSVQGGVLAAFNLLLMVLIYMPFVVIANRADEKEQEM